jgi:hypothetical protein
MAHQQPDDAPQPGIGARGRTGGGPRFGFDLDAGIINSCWLLVFCFYKLCWAKRSGKGFRPGTITPTLSVRWDGHSKMLVKYS